jgi:hypothetical protein
MDLVQTPNQEPVLDRIPVQPQPQQLLKSHHPMLPRRQRPNARGRVLT